jgi:hypothetical protein
MQLVNNWFWRSGLLSSTDSGTAIYNGASQPAWWTQFTKFQQTLGSFGGGDITVRAGRNITNLQAMAPTEGWADSTSATQAVTQTIGGGDITVSAGQNLLGGQFFTGRGVGRLSAGNVIGDATGNKNLTAPMLALMDAQWRLSARSDVVIGSAFNPTAAPASASDGRGPAAGFYFTWGSDAGVSATSNAGDVNLRVGPTEVQVKPMGLENNAAVPAAYFEVLPPNLSLTAPAGNVDLLKTAALLGSTSQTNAVLFPSPSGQLSVWSGGSVHLNGGQLAMSGSDPSTWPGISNPAARDNTTQVLGKLISNTLAGTLQQTSLHAADNTPVQIHADANLELEGNSNTTTALLLPKSAQFSAGADIIQLSVQAQNLAATDVTTVIAGGSFLAQQYGNISVAGPGAVDISAGRNIDLGSSGGVTTSGNLRNAALPAQGASVRLSAATDGSLDVDVLAARYLTPADQGGSARAATYRAALLAFVRDALQQPTLDEATAWAQFKTFPSAAQARFGRQVLASEFGATYLTGPLPSTEQLTTTLQAAFERDKAQALSAGDAALAAGQALTLPGRETLAGSALVSYLAQLRGLSFASLDLDSAIAARLSQLTNLRSGWQQTVASALDDTVAGFAQRAAKNPADPAVLAYQAALADTSSTRFTRYRDQVLASELASTGGAAAQFGKLSLPMRLAFFEQGFQAAELAGVGNFTDHTVWTGGAPLLQYTGALDMTQSSVVTQRGGDISLINPGGAITVGLKDTGAGAASAAKGVITLGGGNIFGFARSDFQVNTQRVFVVGQGDMTLWSSNGDIDSGRGANTAVAAPPLAARRSVDGVVFETPATTTGSGLGILEDASGRRSGTIGLFPAFGEILALDAFIRAPSVVLGSAIKGADNLQAASVGGAAAPVAAPALAAPPPASTESRAADAANAGGAQSQESRPRNALLTVDLLGMGPATDEACDEKDKVDNKCPAPAAKPCSEADKAKGLCKPPGKAP